VELYNGSAHWGETVQAKRDELARWIRWRRIQEEQIAA